ncbi:hypothetical protein ABFQ67_19415, partial [Clostridioides difficile]
SIGIEIIQLLKFGYLFKIKNNFISPHTKQLVLGLTAFFLSKFQIGVMKWCLLELFNKIIGA